MGAIDVALGWRHARGSTRDFDEGGESRGCLGTSRSRATRSIHSGVTLGDEMAPHSRRDRSSSLARRRLSRPVLLLFLCSLLSCFAAVSPLAGDLDYDRDRGMFAEGFDDISRHYIRRVDLRDLVADGLVALGQIDQGLTARRNTDRLDLMYHGQTSADFPLSGQLGPEDLAALVAKALATARQVSPALKAAGSELLYAAMFTGMLDRLDPPYSRYVGRMDAAQDRATRQGYAGIGVHIAMDDGGARITSVIPDTPAEQIGLRADEVIVAIDGTATSGLDQGTVVCMLRGVVGSKVTLTVRPSGNAVMTIVVTRGNVAPQTVQYEREGEIAYLRIFQFGEGTADSVRHGVEDALGGGARGVVLDLRDNPGGLLDQGVAVADLFINSGRILSIRGRDPKDDEIFDATAGDIARGLPVAVLINAGTASAAEILAAALQDNRRAVIVGSNSFGKGTVQGVHRMPNDGELILTIARFYAPSGYSLQHLGVLPTICTSRASEDATTLLSELEDGRLPRLPIEVRNRVSPDDGARLEQLKAQCPASHASNAVDLDVATRLLSQPASLAKAIALADSGTKVAQ